MTRSHPVFVKQHFAEMRAAVAGVSATDPLPNPSKRFLHDIATNHAPCLTNPQPRFPLNSPPLDLSTPSSPVSDAGASIAEPNPADANISRSSAPSSEKPISLTAPGNPANRAKPIPAPSSGGPTLSLASQRTAPAQSFPLSPSETESTATMRSGPCLVKWQSHDWTGPRGQCGRCGQERMTAL